MKRTTTNGPKSFKKAVITLTIPQLFESCLAKEKGLLSTAYQGNVFALCQRLLFGTPLFWPDPVGGWPRFERKLGKSNMPLTFSVARRGDETVSDTEWRYHKILELLREEKEKDLRWLFLARWLKQEGVCQPEKFLPEEVLKRLVRRYRKSKKMSTSDLSYWAVITGWKPYFVRLQSDLQKLPVGGTDPQTTLEKMGYHPKAIKFAMTKKSTVSAIMYRISEQRHIQLQTLRNAYSRV